MPDIAVAIGAYASYASAAKDWDALDLDPAAATSLVDGALIEWREDRVTRVHCSLKRHGWGYGAVASAVVAALWPPALLTGAIAGGVGDRVLTYFARELPTETTAELARVLREGQISAVIVAATPEGTRVVRRFARHGLDFSIATLPGTSSDLLAAAQDDAIGAFEG